MNENYRILFFWQGKQKQNKKPLKIHVVFYNNNFILD